MLRQKTQGGEIAKHEPLVHVLHDELEVFLGVPLFEHGTLHLDEVIRDQQRQQLVGPAVHCHVEGDGLRSDKPLPMR